VDYAAQSRRLLGRFATVVTVAVVAGITRNRAIAGGAPRQRCSLARWANTGQGSTRPHRGDLQRLSTVVQEPRVTGCGRWSSSRVFHDDVYNPLRALARQFFFFRTGGAGHPSGSSATLTTRGRGGPSAVSVAYRRGQNHTRGSIQAFFSSIRPGQFQPSPHRSPMSTRCSSGGGKRGAGFFSIARRREKSAATGRGQLPSLERWFAGAGPRVEFFRHGIQPSS